MSHRHNDLQFMSHSGVGFATQRYPDPSKGVVGSRFNSTDDPAESVFAGGDLSVEILSISVDKDTFTVGNGLTLYQGSGTDKVLEIAAPVNEGAYITKPFYIEGGFNVLDNSAAASVWTICYRVVPTEGV